MDLPGLLGDILTLKLRGFNIGLETMYCLRNLIASWDEGKRYLGEEQRAKSLAGSGNNSPSVVEIIVKYGLSGPVVSDDVVFRAVLDVLKLLCGNQEARKGMMKVRYSFQVCCYLQKLIILYCFSRAAHLSTYLINSANCIESKNSVASLVLSNTFTNSLYHEMDNFTPHVSRTWYRNFSNARQRPRRKRCRIMLC